MLYDVGVRFTVQATYQVEAESEADALAQFEGRPVTGTLTGLGIDGIRGAAFIRVTTASTHGVQPAGKHPGIVIRRHQRKVSKS